MEEYKEYNHVNQLAAFLAYFMYSILAFFDKDLGDKVVNVSTMIDLQQLASQVALSGLMCHEELDHCKPSWESWIMATIKRRTLYSMYMFDNVFNTIHGAPCYQSQELGNLPASGNGKLWNASNAQSWSKEYDLYMNNWRDGQLQMCEFWPGTKDVAKRETRLTKWAKEADAYGTMLMAVCIMIHGD